MPIGPFAEIPATSPPQKIRLEHINELRRALSGLADAYDVAVAEGYTGTRGEWLASLRGPAGPAGASGTTPLGSVATVGLLPASGNSVDDIYTVDADGHAYAWDGSAWVDIGQWRGPQGPGGADTILRGNTGFRPLDVTLTALASGDVCPVDAIGAVLYGRGVSPGTDPSTLYRSTDDGGTWTAVEAFTGHGTVAAVRQMGNGEVIVSTEDALHRSTGWATDPLAATWTVAATATSGAAIIPFTLDVSGPYVLAGEYVVPYTAAKQLQFSQDSGVTFSTVLNLDTMYPADIATTHWHGVCIDPWADTASGVRLWACHGDGPRSLRYSDDLGASWTILSTDWQFTTLTATANGIVCATDENPDGVYLIDRDLTISRLYAIRQGGTTALYGFAQRGFYHDDTGLVYIAFNSRAAPYRSLVLVSDGVRAASVWRSAWDDTSSECNLISVVDGGSVHFHLEDQLRGTRYHATAAQVERGAPSPEEWGAGGQLEGRAGKTSIGIGANVDTVEMNVVIGSDASDGGYEATVVIGEGATAAGIDSVTIGRGATGGGGQSVLIGTHATATGNQAIAIGHDSDAAAAGTAVGQAAQATGVTSVAVGEGTQATQSEATALGRQAVASTANAVSVGAGTNASGTAGTAVGSLADATSHFSVALGVLAQATTNSWAVALGPEANAAHESSVALGRASTTTAGYQHALGARHVEIDEVSDPASPGANKARLYVRDNGAGKTQLCVLFPTGAVQVIATEP